MLVVRIDKHPSSGAPPEHIETVTIANVGESRFGVWRDSRSIQEAPDYTVSGIGVSNIVANALMHEH